MDWALRMPIDRASTAATLRLSHGVMVCHRGEELWLRGGEATHRAVQALPCTARYVVTSGDYLAPPGARVPVARLPEGPWTPIAHWFPPRLPPASGYTLNWRL